MGGGASFTPQPEAESSITSVSQACAAGCAAPPQDAPLGNVKLKAASAGASSSPARLPEWVQDGKTLHLAIARGTGSRRRTTSSGAVTEISRQSAAAEASRSDQDGGRIVLSADPARILQTAQAVSVATGSPKRSASQGASASRVPKSPTSPSSEPGARGDERSRRKPTGADPARVLRSAFAIVSATSEGALEAVATDVRSATTGMQPVAPAIDDCSEAAGGAQRSAPAKGDSAETVVETGGCGIDYLLPNTPRSAGAGGSGLAQLSTLEDEARTLAREVRNDTKTSRSFPEPLATTAASPSPQTTSKVVAAPPSSPTKNQVDPSTVAPVQPRMMGRPAAPLLRSLDRKADGTTSSSSPCQAPSVGNKTAGRMTMEQLDKLEMLTRDLQNIFQDRRSTASVSS